MKSLKTRNTTLLVAALTLGVLWVSEAAAQPKPNVFDGGNRWEITAFNDPSSDHQQWATQVICFLPFAVVGTSIQGAWYSLSFPDWNGRYYQEGDEVKMTGDYAKDVGHDHMTLLHTTFDASQTRGMAFKDWTEWREDGGFGRIIGWANARLTRVGRCEVPPGRVGPELEKRAKELSLAVPPRMLRDGKAEARSPSDQGQECLETYFSRSAKKNQ